MYSVSVLQIIIALNQPLTTLNFLKPTSGPVDKASATETVNTGSIPGRAKPKIRKIGIFICLPPNAQLLNETVWSLHRVWQTGYSLTQKPNSLSPEQSKLMNKTCNYNFKPLFFSNKLFSVIKNSAPSRIRKMSQRKNSKKNKGIFIFLYLFQALLN